MSKSLYLIDGHAQIFRAYYAPFGQLSSPSGEPTRATHVFWQMVLTLLSKRKPDYLGLVLDVSDSTVFRRDIYADYKANRDAAPEDLGVQIARIIEIAQAIQLPTLQLEGWEADDIMASLAKHHASEDLHVYLVSRDKDLEQLLNAHVSLYDPMKDEVITPARLEESKGWTPAEALEAQILIGDSVDNIPGVPGIGPKTAAKLIRKYGSAQAVLEHADELTPKQRENVLAFRDQIDITRQLVTLRDDVPIELNADACALCNIQWANAVPIFRDLGFRKLTTLLPGVSAEDIEDAPPALTPIEAEGDGKKSTGTKPAGKGDAGEDFGGERAAALRATLSRPDGGVYRLINTAAGLREYVAKIAGVEEFAIDTETTGLRAMDARLVGIALSCETGHGVYVPTQSFFGNALAVEEVREILHPVLSNEKIRKVGHNLKYDLNILRNAGFDVRGPLFDTMVAAFLVDPTRMTFGMDRLVHDLFAHSMMPITDLIGKGRDQITIDQVPLERVTEYAGEDADYTWRMYQYYEPQLAPMELDKLFFDVEMPLVQVLARMEFEGVRLDVDFLREMSVTLGKRIDALLEEVQNLVGERFNVDSPKQLSEILFDKLQMRVVKRTKTSRSTDAETLETLARETEHPALLKILEYREMQKLRSTYVDALPQSVSKRTGRVHTSYHQTGAITGRLSSSDPNLQNIPIRTELGREIRRAFVPRTPGERLIVADYSQIELRVLAHFSGDAALRQAFAEDRDIHAFVAAQVNSIAIEDVTSEMRSQAKAVNFGLIYGQTAFGLARTTGMSRGDAQDFIDAYFTKYASIRAFIDKCVADAKRDGYVRTILGRRRPILGIDSRNATLRNQAERLAVNTVIQGSAADLIKLAMIQIDREIRRENLPLRMLLQVHDELVFEAPADDAPRMAEWVKQRMGSAMPLEVPLKVDAGVGEDWLTAK
ncbi:MAG: DNA polymerase I [Phycisphaerae bacterium]